jgi:hypothetical protein
MDGFNEYSSSDQEDHCSFSRDGIPQLVSGSRESFRHDVDSNSCDQWSLGNDSDDVFAQNNTQYFDKKDDDGVASTGEYDEDDGGNNDEDDDRSAKSLQLEGLGGGHQALEGLGGGHQAPKKLDGEHQAHEGLAMSRQTSEEAKHNDDAVFDTHQDLSAIALDPEHVAFLGLNDFEPNVTRHFQQQQDSLQQQQQQQQKQQCTEPAENVSLNLLKLQVARLTTKLVTLEKLFEDLRDKQNAFAVQHEREKLLLKSRAKRKRRQPIGPHDAAPSNKSSKTSTCHQGGAAPPSLPQLFSRPALLSSNSFSASNERAPIRKQTRPHAPQLIDAFATLIQPKPRVATTAPVAANNHESITDQSITNQSSTKQVANTDELQQQQQIKDASNQLFSNGSNSKTTQEPQQPQQPQKACELLSSSPATESAASGNLQQSTLLVEEPNQTKPTCAPLESASTVQKPTCAPLELPSTVQNCVAQQKQEAAVSEQSGNASKTPNDKRAQTREKSRQSAVASVPQNDDVKHCCTKDLGTSGKHVCVNDTFIKSSDPSSHAKGSAKGGATSDDATSDDAKGGASTECDASKATALRAATNLFKTITNCVDDETAAYFMQQTQSVFDAVLCYSVLPHTYNAVRRIKLWRFAFASSSATADASKLACSICGDKVDDKMRYMPCTKDRAIKFNNIESVMFLKKREYASNVKGKYLCFCTCCWDSAQQLRNSTKRSRAKDNQKKALAWLSAESNRELSCFDVGLLLTSRGFAY